MDSIYIPNCGNHNIYHFLIYIVSTLQCIEYVPQHIYTDMTHDYFNKHHNFVIEILNIMYPLSQVHNSCQPTSHMFVVPHHTFGDFHEDKEKFTNSYVYLRHLFLPHIIKYNLPQNYSKKIYISREDSKYRRILNETELMDKLKIYGFEKFVLTGMPLLEQMTLFYNAEVIIAVHGAALTNTLFCKSDTKIIEICTPYLETRKHFEDIAQSLHLNHTKYTNTISIHNHDLMANDIIVKDIDMLCNRFSMCT